MDISKCFLKHFMKWLLLQTKILLLKSGIRKNVAVSLNKELMNKSSSKNFTSQVLVFYFTTPFSGCLKRRI